jgi:two-component system, OmpR family, response regulator RstA
MLLNDNTEPTQSCIESLVVGRLSLNRESRVALVDGREIMLTSAEFELLVYLVAHAGRVVSRDELFQQILGMEYNGLDRTIDLRVSRLRRKLGDHGDQPRLLKSIRSEGYLLTANAQ